MKLKFTFSIIFFIIIRGINAQAPYLKMLKEDTTTWQHYGILFGVQPNRTQIATPQVGQNSYAAIDTITINGNKYKKFYQLCCTGLNYNFKTLTGYLREDTIARKVYYRKNLTSADELWYDFSLNVYDTLYMIFPNSPSTSGSHMVDSIVVKNVQSVPRKHFYIRKYAGNPNLSNNYYEIIEGIGSTYHIAYRYGGGWPIQWTYPVSTTCQPKWIYGLTCKHDDQTKIYQTCIMTNTSSSFYFNNVNNSNNPCDLGYYVPGGLKNNDLEQLVKIGPSPADDLLDIKIESSYQQNDIIISDLSGKEIFNSKSPELIVTASSIEVRTSELANGIYLLQIHLNDKKISRPILIQH